MSWIELNGRSYDRPAAPTVVVCIDGSEPGYIEAAVEAGVAPFFAIMAERGTNAVAKCVVPSFTNPNNLSIVTGAPPSRHGICGNYVLDPESGEEVMMNDPRFLRSATIFAAAQQAGATLAIVTAKDKLRRLLGHGLDIGPDAVCYSAEHADRATIEEHGIAAALDFVGLPLPGVYSAELSEFVFAAGVAQMRKRWPDLMYLSTTDYIQHKHAPGSAAANAFYAMMDRYLGELDALGSVIAVTADHGMKAKHDDRGQPEVIYLAEELDQRLGAGRSRVILPITDPYVVHHGALGSYAVIYLDGEDWQPVADLLSKFDGIDLVLDRETAARRFELPPDRLGDLVVISAANKVLGTRESDHDLSGLNEPLRSHGGLSEQRVPLLLNRPCEIPEGAELRNFDAFDLALNRLRGGGQ